MKTFLFTTLFWFVVLTGGWIYLSSYQSDMLYNTLQTMNPSTEAVNQCLSGIDSLSGSLHAKIDEVLTILANSATSNMVESGSTGTIRVIENLLPFTTTTGTSIE